MMTDSKQWAETVFGESELGDARRTARLVKLAGDLAENGGESVVKACGNPASLEGAYRFIRNDSIQAEAIALSGFKQTDQLVKKAPLVLALQDTTGLSYRHSVCEELGSVSSANIDKPDSKGRSLFAHSTLMIDANSEELLGLGYQYYWYRQSKVKGTKHHKQSRNPTDKESYKWQRNVEALSERLGTLDNVIDVCDREADLYEYLDHQIKLENRFVVRARKDRRLLASNDTLNDVLNKLEPCHYYTVKVAQKGGRKARHAKVALSHTRVMLKKPGNAVGSASIEINVVQCQEVVPNGDKAALLWRLYTTEDIRTPDDARKIVHYYELRWRIEEFHKIWKSDGTQVEALRMQKRDNIKRIATILAFVAVRLYQLRHMAQNNPAAKQVSCLNTMSSLSWKILWKATHKKEPLPDNPPSLYWAYYAIAKLGRWHDSKRNGRVGIKAFWDGWLKLLALVESYEMFKGLDLA